MHDAKDHSGKQPIHHAVGYDSKATEILGCLLRARAQVDARDDAGLTPLAVASAIRDAACVETLLKQGAAPVGFDRTGRAHLEHARTSRRHPEGRPYTAPCGDVSEKLSADTTSQRTWLPKSTSRFVAVPRAKAQLEQASTLGRVSIPRPVTARELPARISNGPPSSKYPRHDHRGDLPHQQLLLHAERSARRKLVLAVSVAERDRLHGGKALLC